MMISAACAWMFISSSAAAEQNVGWQRATTGIDQGTTFWRAGGWTLRAKSVSRSGAAQHSTLIASGQVRIFGPQEIVVIAEYAKIDADRIVLSKDARLLQDGWGLGAETIEIDLKTQSVKMFGLGRP